MARSPYLITEVDPTDSVVADTIMELHELTFGSSAPLVDPAEKGYWWLVYWEKVPVAFAGLTPSTLGEGYGYLKRSGVLRAHRGNGLQRRLLRVREMKARRLGWHTLVTDTTDNVASANSLIKSGYTLFTPQPWAYARSLYWRKKINKEHGHVAPALSAALDPLPDVGEAGREAG